MENRIVCNDFFFLHHSNEEKKIDYDLMKNFYLLLFGKGKLPISREHLFVWSKQLFLIISPSFCSIVKNAI